jgi:CubicO group peptidase (beta-lactamase class C family)
MLHEAATRPDPEPPAQGGHYSDLGYLLLGEALARAGGDGLAQVVEREVTGPLGIADEIFYAASLSDREREHWAPAVAPTERCAYRGRLLRGEVHDENCGAFGGIAGHAGLFGSARGVAVLGLAALDALSGARSIFDTGLLQWAVAPRRGGGYVAGWDTPSREGSSSAGSQISARGFGHLGFTGTSLWCDPERHVVVVLLSNRVHPTRENIQIRSFRPRFHDRMFELFDADLRARSGAR